MLKTLISNLRKNNLDLDTFLKIFVLGILINKTV